MSYDFGTHLVNTWSGEFNNEVQALWLNIFGPHDWEEGSSNGGGGYPFTWDRNRKAPEKLQLESDLDDWSKADEEPQHTNGIHPSEDVGTGFTNDWGAALGNAMKVTSNWVTEAWRNEVGRERQAAAGVLSSQAHMDRFIDGQLNRVTSTLDRVNSTFPKSEWPTMDLNPQAAGDLTGIAQFAAGSIKGLMHLDDTVRVMAEDPVDAARSALEMAAHLISLVSPDGHLDDSQYFDHQIDSFIKPFRDGPFLEALGQVGVEFGLPFSFGAAGKATESASIVAPVIDSEALLPNLLSEEIGTDITTARSTVPLPNPGETPRAYGTRAHQEFPRIIQETNPGAGGSFNVAPGLKGPDLSIPTGMNANYAEMKSLWGRQAPVLSQARKWGFDAQTGRYFFYDSRHTRLVYEGIIQTEKFPSGKFRP